MGRGQNGVQVPGVNVTKTDVDPTRGVWDRFREVATVPDKVRNELERMALYAIYAPQTAFLRGTEVESVPVQPIGLQGGGLAQAALAVTKFRNDLTTSGIKRGLIDSILSIIGEPGWTSKYRISDYNPIITTRLVKTGNMSLYFVDKFMKERRNILSAYDSSEGTLYLLFTAILMLHPGAPKILSLDNVDNALNPAITKKLIENLVRCTCSPVFRDQSIGPDQVFLTSHNPTSLDAIDIFDDQQRVFVVKRNESGATNITRLKPRAGITREDWMKTHHGKRLSELWIENLIPGALGF